MNMSKRQIKRELRKLRRLMKVYVKQGINDESQIDVIRITLQHIGVLYLALKLPKHLRWPLQYR